MGQTMSYPPLDVVIYMAKFLWFEDLHAFTAVSHTINDMMESESNLWHSLMHLSIQRILSIPFSLHMNRPDSALTKMLIRRICDQPSTIDIHILLKYKGPDNVHVVNNKQKESGTSVTTIFEPPIDSDHSDAPVMLTRRTVVSNTHFPCLTTSAKSPRALIPFTKVMPIATVQGQLKKKRRLAHSPVHTACLSSVSYFEGTLHNAPTPTSDAPSMQQKKTIICSLGIASAPFVTRTLLPGDDSFSFGYVNVSGQILQSGRMRGGQCERYGEGDTVGCGVIYPLITGTGTTPGFIFFTKNGILQDKIKLLDANTFFSIAWFPVMGVAAPETASITMNFGIGDTPFLFDVNAFELEHVTQSCQGASQTSQWSSLSDFYMQQICTMQPVRAQRMSTKYISRQHYVKKDTYSLFSTNILLHETLAITDPKTYMHQGAILSDSDEDSSDEE